MTTLSYACLVCAQLIVIRSSYHSSGVYCLLVQWYFHVNSQHQSRWPLMYIHYIIQHLHASFLQLHDSRL
jgi:hypothetical protein